MVPVVVRGPLGTLVESSYGMVCVEDASGTPRVTALIEAADAAGLTKVPSSLRNPRKTTTAGLGDLIRHAVTRGINWDWRERDKRLRAWDDGVARRPVF